MTTSTSTIESRLDAALQSICTADALTRPHQVQRFLGHVEAIVAQGDISALQARAPGFDGCGGFAGTPWDRPARLRPRLWAGSFDADAPYPWMETMSTLRMLAIALGQHVHEDIDRQGALRFLERVLSLNIDKLLETRSEAARVQQARHHIVAQALLGHVVRRLPALDFLRDLGKEVDATMAQRPVWTHRVRSTLELVSAMPGADASADPLLARYVEAVLGPTQVSMRFRDPEAYRKALDQVDVKAECRGMGDSLRRTGLACRQHGALLRHVRGEVDLLAAALGLDGPGKAALRADPAFVAQLIEQTIGPNSAQTAYGLACCLERGVLDRPEVRGGLQRLQQAQPDDETRQRVEAANPGMAAMDALLGGVLRVLGQPLGVGQGANPTCQAARGISLWSQYRPGHLLSALAETVEGDLALAFEGHVVHSSQIGGGLAPSLDPDLDPVSLVLVPHLDRLYDALMRLAAGRGDDPHRWVNPALYGQIVPPGFTTCFDPVTWHVRDHEGFLRRFFATFHPVHNEGQVPVYATPVGLAVTDDRARLIGLHAVTLQRVAEHEGEWRAYFYNPNDEGRQDWGDGVEPAVTGHGEAEGESSLPVDQFASRVYAFHHPVLPPGDPQRVPADILEASGGMARRSWGRHYVWPI